MKRFIALVLILLFPSLSFATTKEWYNNVQYLTKIPKTNLGDILRTKPGTGNLLPTVVSLASDSSPTVSIASGILSVPLYAYSPVVGMAGQYVIGKGLQAAVDLAESYSDGKLQSNSTFKDLLDDLFGPDSENPYPSTEQCANAADIFPDGAIQSSCQTYLNQGKCFTPNGIVNEYGQTSTSTAAQYEGLTIQCLSDRIVYLHSPNTVPSVWQWASTHLRGTWQVATVNWPTEMPQQLSPEQIETLANRIAQEIAANNQTIKDAIKNLLKDNLDLVPDPQQITNQDITNHINQEIYDNRQDNIDYLTNQYNQAVTNNNTELANYYQDKIQEEQARQEEEQAKEEKEESFNPISDNPFEEPYDPGPYDIPERFTSFLNNVKSTGLFSFSSSYFNSLPGGGSPIYTVEAGTYGTHVVDLSETMGTGLAVLKTVLLLLFGFLSIRVVILKR